MALNAYPLELPPPSTMYLKDSAAIVVRVRADLARAGNFLLRGTRLDSPEARELFWPCNTGALVTNEVDISTQVRGLIWQTGLSQRTTSPTLGTLQCLKYPQYFLSFVFSIYRFACKRRRIKQATRKAKSAWPCYPCPSSAACKFFRSWTCVTFFPSLKPARR